jgi:lipooligosaccharide transport system permease protein
MARTRLESKLPDWEMVRRQRAYWLTTYARTWRGSAVSSFVQPLFYVLAMGVLLGGFIDAGTTDLEGAPSYLAFIAPGLVAAHLLWATFRVALGCAVFLLVMAPFGVFTSWVGVLLAWPVLTLVGLGFAGVFFAYSATIKDEGGFAIIYRLLVIPMFLFSGAFFPISNLSPSLEAVAVATPLWHGVDLTRMLVLGTLETGPALVHLGYLVVLALVGWWLAVWRLQKRMAV